MNFLMNRRHLSSAVGRIFDVSTRSIKDDFTSGNRITVMANSDNVVFLTSNGFLDAKVTVDKTIDPELEVKTTGLFTVDSSRLKSIAQSLGGSDTVDNKIELSFVNDTLTLKDVSVKKGAKRSAKLETNKEHHDFEITPKGKFSCTFGEGQFAENISAVAKYVGLEDYKTKFLVLCIHFMTNETRFVCGDGMRFAVRIDPKIKNPAISEGVKHIMPVSQAVIISRVIGSAKSTEVVYKDPQTCYIKTDDGLSMCLKGIPNETYINYENHAFRYDEAKAIVDVSRANLSEAMSLAGATRDIDEEKDGGFHTCSFEASDGKLEFDVKEGRYQCEYTCDDVTFYNLKDCNAYSSSYAWCYLSELPKAMNTDYVRFYLIEETAQLIAEMINLDTANKDKNGMPAAARDKEDPRMLIFMAAIVETQDD